MGHEGIDLFRSSSTSPARSPFVGIKLWTERSQRWRSAEGAGKCRLLEQNLEIWITAMLSCESLPRDLLAGSIAQLNEIAPRRKTRSRVGDASVLMRVCSSAETLSIQSTWQAFQSRARYSVSNPVRRDRAIAIAVLLKISWLRLDDPSPLCTERNSRWRCCKSWPSHSSRLERHSRFVLERSTEARLGAPPRCDWIPLGYTSRTSLF